MNTEPQTKNSQKADYAKCSDAVANDTPMQSAMRELHRQLTDTRFWFGFAAVVLILVVTGPFETADDFNWVTLLGYWSVTAFTTYLVCLVLSASGSAQFHNWGIPQPAAQLLAAIPAGIAVTGVVTVINMAVGVTDPPDPLPFMIQCTLIALAINVMFLIFAPTTKHAKPLPNATKPNIVTDKLPIEKRGDLIRIETQDHYLDVTTSKGSDLILMRLGDAILALEGTGVQTHRSHWVASAHVTGSDRQNNRWVLTLSDGATVPVSRPYVQALRDHGLLPKTR